MGTGWQTRGVPGCGSWRRQRGDCPQQPREEVRGARRKSTLPTAKNFCETRARVPYQGRANPGSDWERGREGTPPRLHRMSRTGAPAPYRDPDMAEPTSRRWP